MTPTLPLHHVLRAGRAGREQKPAIRLRRESLTYAELDAWSSRVAQALSAEGVRRGARVGVYMKKSPAAVTALLGVLKSGAACVPLDIDSPVERLRHIVLDCDLSAVIVDDDRMLRLVRDGKPVPAEWALLQMSAAPVDTTRSPPGWRWIPRERVNAMPALDPDTPASPSDVAYILYTSGSTGQPKGVTLSHKNTRVFVDWAVDYLGLSEGDVFSSHAPFHFDLSILDIYACLAVGGELCLIPPGLGYFPDSVASFVAENGITVWYSVPSAVIQLLAPPVREIERLASIRKLIYAGEVFPFAQLNELRRTLPETTVYNFYGPTETNVITAFAIAPGGPPLLGNVPIGAPCPFARVRVLGPDGRPAPRGEVGELAVRGDSLMSGYWRDPAKTAAAIRPVTFDGNTEHLYFTGDFVFERPDGTLVYVNRRDSMVKTRGFRVELGEVESVLARHPKVQRCAVVAVRDEKIGHRLFAHVALEGGPSALPEVERYCTSALPAYMIPEKMVYRAELPLTSTGKIDRESLLRDSEAHTHG